MLLMVHVLNKLFLSLSVVFKQAVNILRKGKTLMGVNISLSLSQSLSREFLIQAEGQHQVEVSR